MKRDAVVDPAIVDVIYLISDKWCGPNRHLGSDYIKNPEV